MSKPWEHAILSAKKFGGKPDDYLKIHDFMDSSKAHVADMRHRALLHSSFGIYLAERVFGTNIIVNHETDPSRPCMEQHIVSVRDIAEQHVIQDLGFIPSVQQYLDHMELADWMGGKKSFTIQLTAKLTAKIEDIVKKDFKEAMTNPAHPTHKKTVELLRKATAGPERQLSLKTLRMLQKQRNKAVTSYRRDYPGPRLYQGLTPEQIENAKGE